MSAAQDAQLWQLEKLGGRRAEPSASQAYPVRPAMRLHDAIAASFAPFPA